jgi:hypothetical protein
MREVQGNHGPWLWRLLGAFAFRVAAQPAAALTGWPILPPFDAWQSGALPYPLLLGSQVALAGWMARTASRVSRGVERPARGLGRWLAVLAGIYGGAMSMRLVLGLTWLGGHWWFDAPLPTLFHLVLAAYLAVYAHYHLRGQVDAAIPV